MVRRVIIISFFLMLCPTLKGQKDSAKIFNEEKISFKGLALGVTPSAVVNLFPALQISADYGVASWASFTNEFGLIPDKKKWGYRWRPGILFHAARARSVALSMGVAFNYRKAFVTREEEVLRAQGQFTELVDMTTQYKVEGFVLVGFLHFVPAQKFLIRIGGGLGPGKYTSVNLDDPTANVDIGWLQIRDGRHPIFFTHLNLSYYFGQNKSH